MGADFFLFLQLDILFLCFGVFLLGLICEIHVDASGRRSWPLGRHVVFGDEKISSSPIQCSWYLDINIE